MTAVSVSSMDETDNTEWAEVMVEFDKSILVNVLREWGESDGFFKTLKQDAMFWDLEVEQGAHGIRIYFQIEQKKGKQS